MAKAALTPARIEVLSALAQGAHAERVRSYDHASWEWVRHPDGRTTKLRRGTLSALFDAGWLQSSELDVRRRKFVITDAGRAALEREGRTNA